MTKNTTTDPSPQRRRFEEEERKEKERKARESYRSQLITWNELFGDYWEAGSPGN